MHVNTPFRQSCLKRKSYLCKCIPMSSLPPPTPPISAEGKRRPNDIWKPGGGTQKTLRRSRLILHWVAMNLTHPGHQIKRCEYPRAARLAISPKVFPLLKSPSFLLYKELLTTDGSPHSNPPKRALQTATSKVPPWSPPLPAPGTGQGLLKNPTAASCDLQRGS